MVGSISSKTEKMSEMWQENKDGKILLLLRKVQRFVVRDILKNDFLIKWAEKIGKVPIINTYVNVNFVLLPNPHETLILTSVLKEEIKRYKKS